jgi:hypothetical protein
MSTNKQHSLSVWCNPKHMVLPVRCSEMLLVEHAHLYSVWRFVECGGCANRPQSRWGPHLVGSSFTLALARLAAYIGPICQSFIHDHVACNRRPLDIVLDELLLECLPMLAVKLNTLFHPSSRPTSLSSHAHALYLRPRHRQLRSETKGTNQAKAQVCASQHLRR